MKNEDQEFEDARDDAIEKGLVCTECGCSIDKPYKKSPSQCEECKTKEEE